MQKFYTFLRSCEEIPLNLKELATLLKNAKEISEVKVNEEFCSKVDRLLNVFTQMTSVDTSNEYLEKPLAKITEDIICNLDFELAKTTPCDSLVWEYLNNLNAHMITIMDLLLKKYKELNDLRFELENIIYSHGLTNTPQEPICAHPSLAIRKLLSNFDPKLSDATGMLLLRLGDSLLNYCQPSDLIASTIPEEHLPLVKSILQDRIVGRNMAMENEYKNIYNSMAVMFHIMQHLSPEILPQEAKAFYDGFSQPATYFTAKLSSIAFNKVITIVDQYNPSTPIIFDAHRFNDGSFRGTIHIQAVPEHFSYLTPIQE